jgi:type II secretory pathway pseudopilin PulG
MIPCQPHWRLQNPKTQTGVCVERHSLEVDIMKVIQSLIVVASVAAAVALPSVSFAQSNQPLTRAEVRAQLVELQNAGYNPASDQTQYPKNIQAAEARIDAQKNVLASSYGSSTYGSSASGSPHSSESDVIGLGPIYAKP